MDMMIEVRIVSHITNEYKKIDKYDKKSVIYLLKQNDVIVRDGIKSELKELNNA
jgi:hypothetical protein